MVVEILVSQRQRVDPLPELCRYQRDYYMTGEEAKSYGIVDEVLTPATISRVPALITSGNGS